MTPVVATATGPAAVLREGVDGPAATFIAVGGTVVVDCGASPPTVVLRGGGGVATGFNEALVGKAPPRRS